LSSYSLTYTGYQLFENLTTYTNAARVKVGGTKVTRPSTGGSQLPATGVGAAGTVALLAIPLAVALAIWRKRHA
jgi:hypothetical protein